MLVGRDAAKLEKLSQISGVKKFTTNLDEVMKDSQYQVYFDSQTTGRRADGVREAVKAGKHLYCEKPTAVSTAVAMELYELCKKNGIKNGVVQDKLWLPGIVKLKRLIENGFIYTLRYMRCTKARHRFHLSKYMVENISPVAKHVDNNSAIIFLAVVP